MLRTADSTPQNPVGSPLLTALGRAQARANREWLDGGSSIDIGGGLRLRADGEIEWDLPGAGDDLPSPAKARRARPKAAPGRRLGKNANTVRHSPKRGAERCEENPDKRKKTHQEIRMDRLRWQRHAASLLEWQHRIGLCRFAIARNAKGVGVDLRTYEAEKAGAPAIERAVFSGLQTCGNVWLCPCCSPAISETRKGEMNRLLAWARAEGHVPVMVTLTARHGVKDRLWDLLEAMKTAKQKWRRHRRYRKIEHLIVGSVTATEITFGAHGWHPHFHIILIVRDQKSTDANWAAIEGLERLREAWTGVLPRVGLSGNGAAFDLQGAESVGDYITKWGAAEEIVMGSSKQGRGGKSRSPLELLADSCDADDEDASAAWREYADAFISKRRNQLVWSPGLKADCGVAETSDEEAAEEGAKAEEQEKRRNIAKMNGPTWKGTKGKSGGRSKRGLILNAAENEGADGIWAVLASDEDDPVPERWSPIEEDEDKPAKPKRKAIEGNEEVKAEAERLAAVRAAAELRDEARACGDEAVREVLLLMAEAIEPLQEDVDNLERGETGRLISPE
jgi:hypothetical protein